jgi:hypothetical protein
MKTGRRDANQHVAWPDAPAIDERLSGYGADDKTCDIVFTVSIEAGHLRCFAADQRAAILLARGSETLDDLHGDVGIEPAGRKIIQKKQRLSTLHQDVVDAMIDEIDTDRIVDARHEGNAKLGTDAVGAGNENRIAQVQIGEGEQPAERSDIGEHAAGERISGKRSNATDELVAGVDVHTGLLVVHTLEVNFRIRDAG